MRIVHKALHWFTYTQDQLAEEELTAGEAVYNAILADQRFQRLSGTNRFLVLFNLVATGVHTIEDFVASEGEVKPN